MRASVGWMISLLGAVPPAAAGDSTGIFPRVGMGFSFAPETVLQGNWWGFQPTTFLRTALHLSVNLPGWKVDPEISYNHVSLNTGGDASTATLQSLQGTVGAFGRTVRSSTGFFYGLRAGMGWESLYVSEEGGIDFYRFQGGPAAGAEHLLSPHFSLGLEGRLMFTYLPSHPLRDMRIHMHTLERQALLTFRWYL